MDDSIALKNHSLFKENVKKAKEKTYLKLISKLDDAKLTILKSYLKEKNIAFDDSISDLKTFISKVVNKLDATSRNEINALLKKATEELQKLIDELKANSTTAFSRFLNNTYTSLIKPLSKGTAISLASRTALILAPTIESKLAVGAGIAAHTVYKLVKNNKYRNVIDQNYECNRILQELEVRKDKDGHIIDTRFNKTIQDSIIRFLNSNNIDFLNTGYLSLREFIYNMDLYERIKIANVINNNTGNIMDVNGRISKYDRDFRQKLKTCLIPIVSGAGIGAGVATAMNDWDPIYVAAPINGTALGTWLGKLTNSPVIGWMSGVLGVLGTAIIERIPIVGDIWEKFLKLENLGALSAIGAICGFTGIMTIKTIQAINNMKKKIHATREQRLILDKDSMLYKYDDKIEYEKIKEMLQSKGQSVEELAILGIVNLYMQEREISINGNISTIEELKTAIKNSKSKEKAELLELIIFLDEYNKRDTKSFKKYIKKIGSIIYWGITLGLAGLSILDILNGSGLLENISEGIFKDTKGLLKKTTPVLDRVSPAVTPTPTPKPTPTPVIEPKPAPAPAPVPTLDPSKAAIYARNPAPISNSELTEIIGNIGKFIKKISDMPIESTYKQIIRLKDPDLVAYCADNLSTETMNRLIEYMNSSPDINTENMLYKIMKQTINNRVIPINEYVDSVRGTTRTIANLSAPVIAGINARPSKK